MNTGVCFFYRKIYGSQRHPTIKEGKEFKEFKEVKKKLPELLKNPHLSQTVRISPLTGAVAKLFCGEKTFLKCYIPNMGR